MDQTPRTDKAHKEVFDLYLSVIKKYGEYASLVPKTKLYSEVADINGYSIGRVGQIVRMQLRKNRNKDY